MEALLIASTAVQAIGAVSKGNAAKAAAGYNAALMDQEAAAERQQASAREEQGRRQAAQVLGAQRAAFAQSGGGMGGSAADVMRQSSINAELDALTMRYEGELRARGLESQAAAERFAGKQAQRAGYFEAAGTILGGAAKYGDARETRRLRQAKIKEIS